MMHLLTNLVKNNARTILILASILAIFGVSYGTGVFSQLKTDEGGLSVEGSESNKASKYIKDTFGGDSSQVIMLVSSKSNAFNIESLEFEKVFDKQVSALEKDGATVTTYYDIGAKELVSKDRRAMYAIVSFSDKTNDEIYKIINNQKDLSNDSVEVSFGGTPIANKQITHQIENDLVKAELISLPVLLILLLVIFRSVVAAVLPVLLGIFAILGGMSVVRALASFVDIDQYAINIITVLGLGLSIDYSLLMVSRYREELLKHDPLQAIKRTMHSSGRTILFSGLTVMICLLGLVFFPISFLRSVGVGGIAALIVTLVAALTILPSILLLLGNNINRWAISRRQIAELTKQQGERWRKLGQFVLDKPYKSIVVAIFIILVAALPLSHINLKSSGFDYRNLPRNSSSREVSRSLTQDFDNRTPSLEVVYMHNGPINTASGIKDVYDLTNYVSNLEGVDEAKGLVDTSSLNAATYQQMYQNNPQPEQLSQLEKIYLKNNSTYIKVYTEQPTTSIQTQSLVKKLRGYKPIGGEIMVNGPAAIEYDIRESVTQKAPIALGLVVLAMMILLSLLLRSIVIPLQSLLINSFSMLASFGILVWIFQDGNLTNLGWFMQTGSLDLTILILIFAITLGLSMDYATFYYSRVREEFDRSKNTNASILNGLVLTGPVITQAALLLFVVVIAFASSSIALLQQIGLGLAIAVFIDAFIVRVILVPSIMKISGSKNWYTFPFLRGKGIKHD